MICDGGTFLSALHIFATALLFIFSSQGTPSSAQNDKKGNEILHNQ